MSLKAKLEAVIYAAEEPVTLAQLAALFSTESLEWRAEQEAASAAAAAAHAEETAEPLPLLNAAFDYLDLELAAEPAAGEAEADRVEPGAEPAAAGAGEASSETGEEAGGETPSEAVAAEAAPEAEAEPAALDAEAEARRQARQRDREVRLVLRGLLDELMAGYASDDRGIEIKEIAGGYRMATKPECHDAARMFAKSLKPALKLSLPALETLAVIAYKQPVTAPEVNEIRGVDSSGVFGSLLARKLIATAGRKQVIGRPILYKTTKEFLLRFGLKDVTELPSMDEFEKMAQLEFDEAEMGGGGETAPDVNEDPRLEVDDDEDEPGEEAAADVEQQTQQGTETAVRADSEVSRAVEESAATEQPAGAPADEAASTPAEAAPAAPSPPEQAEIENVSHE
jgi:segregation and condensation protein B